MELDSFMVPDVVVVGPPPTASSMSRSGQELPEKQLQQTPEPPRPSTKSTEPNPPPVPANKPDVPPTSSADQNGQSLPDIISIQNENKQYQAKISKLKSLLGRSAKAQRDASAELQLTKSKLIISFTSVEKLEKRVNLLENRPSHFELLADFETNFDRAVLSMKRTGQPGGEESEEPHHGLFAPEQNEELESAGAGMVSPLNEDSFFTELSECKSRLEQLESLNGTLHHRAAKLERENEVLTEERDAARMKAANLSLTLRMAKLETEKSTKNMKEKSVALAEMQMEIDLVTRSSLEAISRASQSMEEAKKGRSSKVYVEELEMKVNALQEWALASAESKRLTMERAMDLQQKVKDLENVYTKKGDDEMEEEQADNGKERKLWAKTGSKVVGAGREVYHIVELGTGFEIAQNESLLLRWKFDIVPGDMNVDFAIVKGRLEEGGKPRAKLTTADYLIPERTVDGGAGGEVAGAFAVQNSCSLVFSNTKAWVRPKSVKFTVEAFAVKYRCD